MAQSGLGKTLEFELQRKLNQAWIGISVVGRDLAKSVIVWPRCCAVETGSRDAKLRMIEEIEEFRSELQAVSLSKHYSFKDGPIEVIDSRCPEGRVHASLCSVTPVWRGCKAGLVEPIGEAVSARFVVASGYNIGPYILHAKVCEFQIGGSTRPRNLKRETALEGGDPVNSPTANDLVYYPATTVKEHPAMTKGQIKHIADDKPLRYILRRKRILSLQVVIVLD